MDSKNSEDVMGFSRGLNRTVQIIVLVTHNPHNCAYADRTIVLRDGKVVHKPEELHAVSQRLAAGGQ